MFFRSKKTDGVIAIEWFYERVIQLLDGSPHCVQSMLRKYGPSRFGATKYGQRFTGVDCCT